MIYIILIFVILLRSKFTNNSSTSSTVVNNGEATKRFANAKSISSDQYFGNNRMSEVNIISKIFKQYQK
jgi:hypothetical protein